MKKKWLGLLLAAIILLSLALLVAAPSRETVPGEQESLADSLPVDKEPAGGPDLTTAVANDEGVYRVLVTAPDGKPVEGVKIQFCDDEICRLATTDAEGTVSFDAEEGSYTVHILKVPDGYEKNDSIYDTLDTFCDVYVILTPAA